MQFYPTLDTLHPLPQTNFLPTALSTPVGPTLPSRALRVLGIRLGKPRCSPSLYPLSRLLPLLPTQCRSWARIPDVADPAAMSRRDSKEGWPNAGTVDTALASLRSSELLRFPEIQRGEPLLLPMEVHGVAATPKVLDAHGGRSQDPADP